MSKRKRQQRPTPSREDNARHPPRDWARSICLGTLASLVVATPLLPSEGLVEGFSTPLVMGWLALFAIWLAVLVLQPGRGLILGLSTWAVAGLAGWWVLCTVVRFPDLHGRAAINAAWIWVGYAAAFFLTRQLVRRAEERRALVWLLALMTVCLSLHGLHQYFVSMPETRQEFEQADEAEKQRRLREENLDPTPGSPDRRHFVDRLRSTEPVSTFALTNSLAGFLVTGAMLLLGIGWSTWRRRASAVELVAVLVGLLLVTACLALTKSRTAYLAAAAGVVLFVVFIASPKRLNWKFVAAAGAVVGGIGVLAVLVGGLDLQVVSEAFKSLSYRFEYWRATLGMIADHPLFGCGPGGFQQTYAHYKLPESSESISDPHNFLLEIWANAGTPGLLLLILVVAAAARELRRGRVDEDDSSAGGNVEGTAGVTAIIIGAVLGLGVALAFGQRAAHIPDLWVFILFFAAGACLAPALLWVRHGDFSPAMCIATLVVLLINLLAAGALAFPGVTLPCWLLLALALGPSDKPTHPPRPSLVCGLVLAAVVVLACGRTAYSPLEARLAIQNPLASHSAQHAQLVYEKVAHLDPYWAEPWRRLAHVRLHLWMQSRRRADLVGFEEALSELFSRSPNNWVLRDQHGSWRIAAYRAAGDRAHLRDAVGAQRRAVELFPNSAFLHARLAWVLQLDGKTEEARREAVEALRLDALHPHAEQKLSRRRIDDPGPPSGADQPPGPGGRNAEQCMQDLRNG